MKSILISFIIVFFACTESDSIVDGDNDEMIEPQDTISQKDTLTYLALGDSYTIGESVEESERYPVQLVSRLNENGVAVNSPQIIAKTGWTTDELQKAISSASLQVPYDRVSLLIGVNNQYRGYPITQYEKEFEELLKQALYFAGNDPANVFVLSIPDYGVTSFGQSRDPEKIARELDAYNEIAKGISDVHEVKFFNITTISRAAKSNPLLIADDGLHPSGKMYRLWVEEVLPWLLEKSTNE